MTCFSNLMDPLTPGPPDHTSVFPGFPGSGIPSPRPPQLQSHSMDTQCSAVVVSGDLKQGYRTDDNKTDFWTCRATQAANYNMIDKFLVHADFLRKMSTS